MQKNDIRRATRTRVRSITECNRAQKSSALCRRIVTRAHDLEAITVALFASLDDEPQTAEAIATLTQYCRVVLPRIEGDEMEFYDTTAGMQSGSYGIMEPCATTPIAPADIDVMIVPGVAFTRDGARLGRGKGFYDRYLSRAGFRATTIGLCYAEQIVEQLPLEPHDRHCDEVMFE